MTFRTKLPAAFAAFIIAGVQARAQCSFEIVPSPNPAASGAALSKLAVVSEDDVWAVGNKSVSAGNQTLIEHWNGVAWSVTPSPNGPFATNYLTGVSAVATNDVWAVGYSMSASVAVTLVEHWNGATWSVVPSPNVTLPTPIQASNKLFSVVALAANDVWAVGQTFDFTDSQTLIIHWNGTAWSAASSPSPGNQGVLYGVTATSPTDVWAAGDHSVNGSQTSLIERFTGASWSVVPSPNVGPFLNSFLSVRAIGPNDVWAVGQRLAVFGVNQVYQTAALHWNGTAWTAVPTPNVNMNNQYFFDVSGAASNDVWAVGLFDTGTTLQTLVEHWDGSQWSIVPSPNAGTFTDELFGVMRATATDVWAVGDSFDGFQYVTLTERLGGDGQPNGPLASLTLNGIGNGTCPGPRHLSVTSGTPVTLAFAGPPNAPLILAAGAAANPGIDLGCTGILSIGTPPSLADVVIVVNGLDPFSTFHLDAGGSLAFTAPTAGVAPGTPFHVQAAVIQPAGSACGVVLTAEVELLVT